MSGTTEHTASGDGERDGLAPAQLLAEMQAIRDQTSAAARSSWLPLVLFGALICGSLPFYELLPRSLPDIVGPLRSYAHALCQALGNQPCHVTVSAVHLTVVATLGYYWQIAIPAGVVLTVLWYRWRGSRVGLRTPSRGFLITGLVLGELVLLVPLLIDQSGAETWLRLVHDTHQAGPLVIIATLLWVLARAERSVVLAVVVAVYLAAALAVSPFDNGGLAGGALGTAYLSLTELRLLGLLPALILLAAGSAAALSQRQNRRVQFGD